MNKNLLIPTAALLPAVAAAQEADSRPNIMLIVVDDMGYSDLECFGGEVESPNLTGLAENGVRFTQFFNSGRSCPSRAQLLTGCYAQTVGITGMGLSLTKDCVTIPEVLRQSGYHTAMSGKWHLSLTQGIGNNADQMAWLSHQNTFNNRPFAPLDTYPCNRGFDEHWGTIWGVVNHFDPFSLVHNEEPIYTDAIPEDFYSTDFITQKAIDMLDDLDTSDDPFFMYVSFNAPHWPLHAKPADIAKYKGRYDEGWDVLRERRYNRMLQMGLITAEETPVATNASGRSWDNETNKAFEAANMEVHAAMVDCVDQGIGRILQKLKDDGVYDNTIIIFTSDNGASSENYTIGDFDRHDRLRNGDMVTRNSATPGNEHSYNYLHTGWAGAVNTPFRYWKTTQFHGGTASPTIVSWPAGMSDNIKGSINREPCHYIDLMPTVIEVAGATYPDRYNNHKIQSLPAEGQSILPLITGEGAWNGERTLFWEHEGGRAVRVGNWRLTALSGGKWQLFNLANDYSETTDLSAQYPDRVREMKKQWNQWAESVGLETSNLVIQEGKTYTIANRNDNTLYVQDNAGSILQMGAINENSYWTFEPTGAPDCYYIRNVATGRYAQACSADTEVNITMGTTPVEYRILDEDGEGANCFGITSTNLAVTDFTDGCIGWNWKGDNTVQTYAAVAGTNHRSFWKLTETVIVDNSDSWPLDGKVYTIKNNGTAIRAYMQDNNADDDHIDCATTLNEGSYWTFEKSELTDYHCYYVRNVETNRYIQPHGKQTEQPVSMGDEKAEYYVRNFTEEGGGYGFSFTGNQPYNFTSGTVGLNLRGEASQDGYVQTYAAAKGTNHRSFWFLTEIPNYETGVTELGAADEMKTGGDIYDLQGRRLAKRPQTGLYIYNHRLNKVKR